MFCAELVLYNVQIEVLIDNFLIGIIWGDYIDFH
jgi:hypothetical protein